MPYRVEDEDDVEEEEDVASHDELGIIIRADTSLLFNKLSVLKGCKIRLQF